MDVNGGVEENRRYREIVTLGTPSSTGVDRVLSNVVLHYTHDRRLPLWVQEHLSKETLKGDQDRKGIKFHSDESVDSLWRSNNSDYWNSGWSRGHMAPAGNNKKDESSMAESFLLSNIVPQDIQNNNDYWNRLEIYCRDITHKYSNVWVTSGPAFLPTLKEGKNVIQYQVIGDNEVAVPTHLFKVVVTEDQQGARALGAFLVPNEPIVEDQPLKHFQVPLETLERRVGFRFYDRLDRSSAADLCEVDGCNMLTKLQLRQFVYVKQINRVKKKEALDKLWNKVKAKQFPVTPEMQTAYDKKLEELTVEVAATGA